MSVIRQMAATSNEFYRTYQIPKRAGGTRLIDAPMPALKRVQKVILRDLLSCFEVSESSHAYVKNRSIITNASTHLEARNILRIDIKDFFGSISLAQIYNVFSSLNIAHETCRLLSLICTKSGFAPQGAPTSPCLSNIIMREADNIFSQFAAANSLRYSRYSDDIYFSGEEIPLWFISYVEGVLNSYGFELNPEKTRLMTEGRMIVTGISISTGKLHLPRPSKRSLRNEAEIYAKYGLFRTEGISDPFLPDRILGRLYFWKFVEPNNERAHLLIGRVKSRMRRDYALAEKLSSVFS